MIKYALHIWILVAVLLSTSACNPYPAWQRWVLDGPPPGQDYTPLYVEGWQDGCFSATSAASNQWYKFFYEFRQDPIKAQNRVYYKGWKDAFTYCNRYLYQYNRRTIL